MDVDVLRQNDDDERVDQDLSLTTRQKQREKKKKEMEAQNVVLPLKKKVGHPRKKPLEVAEEEAPGPSHDTPVACSSGTSSENANYLP